MNEKTVKNLSIATGVAILGAILFNSLRDGSTAARATDEPLVPALQERINDVRSIVIEGQEGPITLTGGAGGWSLEEKSGYPANDASARELLLALRDARRLEQKTSDPERLGRLGLDAPGAEESQSKRITLKDESGATIASVLVGKRRFGKGGGAALPGGDRPDEQYYVLPEADGPSFLAAGSLRVDGRPIGWLEQQFLDVAMDRVQAVRIAHADGVVLEAFRPDMDANDMTVLDVPEGKIQKASSTASFPGALARLRFDDVRKEGEIEWAANPLTTTEYFTENGLVVVCESIELPKEGAPDQKVTWARFRFEVDPDRAPALPADEGAMGPEPPEDGSAEDGSAEEGSADDGAPEEPQGPTAEELQAEADEFTAATAGWAYALPSWKTRAFRPTAEDLLEDAPEPEPAPEEVPAEVPEEDAGAGTDPPADAGDGGDDTGPPKEDGGE
ncbi:MAG: DUF4340 domain-containing protein [Planctomycetota bacterium]